MSAVEYAEAIDRRIRPEPGSAPVLALMAIALAFGLLWNAACYGAGWCRWKDPRCAMDENGRNLITGTWQGIAGADCGMEFRLGGWSEPWLADGVDGPH